MGLVGRDVQASMEEGIGKEGVVEYWREGDVVGQGREKGVLRL